MVSIAELLQNQQYAKISIWVEFGMWQLAMEWSMLTGLI